MERLNREEQLFLIQKYMDNTNAVLKNTTEGSIEYFKTKLELSSNKNLYKQVFLNINNNSYNHIYQANDFNKDEFTSKLEREMANDLFLNKKHNERVHRKILYKYSKSAALAPTESEELASAIANRSSFLLHTKKYQYCINDIDYALSLTKSLILKSKLLCRKVECLLAMNKKSEAKIISTEASETIENISNDEIAVKTKLTNEIQKLFSKKYPIYEAQEKKAEVFELIKSKELPYMSEAVSFKYNSKFGKHLVATRDIATGEVLIIEKPYCIYPLWDVFYTVCSYCVRQTYNNIPCKNCIYAVYCSEKCQKLAYEEYHDVECSINPLLYATFPSNMDKDFEISLFSARLFIKLIKDFGIEEIIRQATILDANKVKGKTIFPENSDLITKDYNIFQIFYGLMDPIDKNHTDGWEPKKMFSNFPKIFLESLKKKNYYSKDLNDKNISILNKIFTDIMYKFPFNGYQVGATRYLNFDDASAASSLGHTLNKISGFINHNCYSNAGKFFLLNESLFVIFANRTIKKNEQVFINYRSTGGLDNPKEHRESVLRQYNFECNCIACVNNWPPVNDELTGICATKVFSNKNKYKDIYNAIKLYMDLDFSKDYKPWTYNKTSIKKVCEAIEKSYSFHKEIEGAVIVHKLSLLLDDLFGIVYNDYFKIPKDC